MPGNRAPRWDKQFSRERHPSNLGGTSYWHSTDSGDGAGRLRIWPFVALICLVEVLLASGVIPLWPGAIHEVALPPLGLLSDMELLVARSASIPMFVGLLIVDLIVRSAVLSLVISSRWSLKIWLKTAEFYLVSLIPCFIAAELIYSGQAILYSPLFWAGILVSVLLAIALSPMAWRMLKGGHALDNNSLLSRGTSWHDFDEGGGLITAVKSGIRSGFNVPAIALYLIALILLSTGSAAAGSTGVYLGVIVSGILSVYAARYLSSRHSGVAVKRLLGLTLVAVLVIVGLYVPINSPQPSHSPSRLRGTLFLVGGIDTSSGYGAIFDLRPQSIGYSCLQAVYYSYAGTGNGAAQGDAKCPITSGKYYTQNQTTQPIGRSVYYFRQEVGRLHSPVTVVAHSSGAWIAWDALSGWKNSPVRELILLAPVSHSIGYVTGQSGSGIVGSLGLRTITRFGRSIKFGTVRSRDHLLVPMEARGQAQRLFSTALPNDIKVFAIESSYDLATFGKVAAPRAVQGCPLLLSHTEMAYSPVVMYEASRFLHGSYHDVNCPAIDRWPEAVAAGWRLPQGS